MDIAVEQVSEQHLESLTPDISTNLHTMILERFYSHANDFLLTCDKKTESDKLDSLIYNGICYIASTRPGFNEVIASMFNADEEVLEETSVPEFPNDGIDGVITV